MLTNTISAGHGLHPTQRYPNLTRATALNANAYGAHGMLQLQDMSAHSTQVASRLYKCESCTL